MIQKRALPWREDPYFDPETRREVQQMWDDPFELENAFFTDLQFGTGGLRGIMGVGTYRMNIYTVRKATQGLANYIRQTGLPLKGVVIGYDSRHHSRLFAEEAARVLAGNQIAVFICHELRPTPFISFACRHLQAQAAIMITASHNPKTYNGYKVYWGDGAQIVSPHDQGIMDEMGKIPCYSDITLSSLDDPLIQWIGSDIDQAYLDTISSLPILSDHSHRDLQICYSSLHGTGITLLPQALEQCGFQAPILVASQCTIDGDFPTVSSPNPESPSALEQGIELLVQTKSDILLVTDPDADRLGVVVLHQGAPVYLNGHQLAALGAYYLCHTLSTRKMLPAQSAIVTTLVTTPLIDRIGSAYHVKTIRVLTGFKYIGEQIHQWENHEDNTSFLFGAEESYGYLIGTYTRDKDGISAACLFASIAADLKAQGKSCVDLLHEIYAQFGIFQEKALSWDFSDGKAGVETVRYLMQSLRESPPASLDDQTIVRIVDYLYPTTSLPAADVLQWSLEDGSSVIIRPSGTEPKLKIYLSVYHLPQSPIETIINKCQASLERLSDSLHNHVHQRSSLK